MTLLTAGGSFAKAYLALDNAEIASSRKLTEKKFVAKLASANTVIHNASTINCSDISIAVEHNFEFTKQLVELLKEVNPSVHLILLSSMSVLDNENDQIYADVLDMPAYAYSKYLAETYCLKSNLQHLSCVRFSTLFYKDPQKDGLSKLVCDAVKTNKITLINQGIANRDFLPLDIAVEYISKITALPPEGNKIYNLAAGKSKSFHEIAEMLIKLIPTLQIDNLDLADSHSVLSSFKTDGIDSLGRIKFSLEDSIGDYVKELQP